MIECRKMLDQSSKYATQDSDKHSVTWWMFMSSTLQASIFMGMEFSGNLRSIKNTGNNLTLKQMFDTSEKLIVGTIRWDLWSENNYLGWFFMETFILGCVMSKSSVSRTRRFTYFHILCNVLERWTRTHNQILSGKTNWRGSRVHRNTELWTQMMRASGIPSGIFSQDSPHCSSATKSKSYCQDWA